MVEDFIKKINIALEDELQNQLQSKKDKTYSEVIRDLQQSKFTLKPYEVLLVDVLQNKITNAGLEKIIKD